MGEKLILGVESSCDETAAAVVKDGKEVLSNVISSQVDIHTLYGGVVPEIASRKHMEQIDQVVTQALLQADVPLSRIDAVCVTYGPGLVGALLVGVNYAKALAFAAHKPFVGVNHICGHIAANYIEHPDLKPPFLCLVVSGGHTSLVQVESYTDFKLLGCTHDDAAGEAFDKVARAIGLGYPGGPKIDKIAGSGNPDAIAFPRAKIAGAPLDFSFSGVKSAVLNYLNQCQMQGKDFSQADVAASFQKAVVDVLVSAALEAAKQFGQDRIALAGGVASNSYLRKRLKKECEKEKIALYYPSPIYCTDNAAMIAVLGYHKFMAGETDGWDLNAVPRLQV